MNEDLQEQIKTEALKEASPEQEKEEHDGERPAGREGKHRRNVFVPFMGGFFAALIAVLVGVVLIRGYLMISFGRLGVLTIRMPYYKFDAQAKDGSLNMPEINRKMKEIQTLIGSAYLYDENVQDVTDGIFTGMLYGLTREDKYAQYYSVKVYAEEVKRNNGSYEGIGVTVQTDPDTNGILVISVNSQGPAKEAGIEADDIIIKADGVDLREMSLDEAISMHIKGPAGTTVDLTVLRDGEELELTVGRAQILDITVRGIMMPGTDLGYVSITSFNLMTEKEFKNVWTQLKEQGAKGIVVDLRNNGGGDMNVALRMLDYVLDDHLTVVNGGENAVPSSGGRTVLLSVEDRSDKATVYYAEDKTSNQLPIVLVVNSRSASAAEIFAGVMMDYGYASVGEKTYGKGIVQSVYQLSDQSAVKFTTNQYRLPGGDLIHGKGIEPTLAVEFEDFDDVTFAKVNFAGGEETDLEKDTQIRAAADLLEKSLGETGTD